ncbi:hypothetical protein FPV67DRAFT_388319 [Lyophyllum atratum]|nr:hypothetical protein FPV67DRAFT_388319 [Lyophyllum atratum]
MGSPTSTAGSSFPTEILLPIFIDAYLNSRHEFRSKHDTCLRVQQCIGPSPCKCSNDDKLVSSKWRNDDLAIPFPYPISAVCQRWRDIVESVPAFWTRIVVFVDTRPTPPSRILKQLRLSGTLELDVFILRRPETYIQDDVGEHERCRAVIDLLMPHLHRCRAVSFDVINTSSLPSISRDFRGPALALTELTLKARVDDGSRSSVSLQSNELEPFHCPNLSKIDIDGRNFAQACLDLPSWQACLSAVPRERFLSIRLSTFTPKSAGDHRFTTDLFLAFLATLPTLHRLTLEDVEFSYVESSAPPAFDERARIYPSCFTAIGLTAGFMRAILDGTDFDSLEFMHVERCGLTGAHAPHAGSLTLTDISAGEDLEGFLRPWWGYSLDVVRCPGFDDAVLRTAFEADVEKTVHLRIEDCEGFSAGGLRAMVKGMMNVEGGGVSFLEVSGWGPRAPEEKEWKWFNRRVKWFSWEAKERE